MRARQLVVIALGWAMVTSWSAAVHAAPPPGDVLRMTGGGSVMTVEGRATFGLTLECAESQNAENGRDMSLEIHWAQNRFRLTDGLATACGQNDPENRHDGGFQEGRGTGTCNGEEGTSVSWTLVDGGKGNPDSVDFNIGGVPEEEAVARPAPAQLGCFIHIAGESSTAKKIPEGGAVEFEVTQGAKGKQAANVRPV